ncbi:MAG: hypothetical protein IKD06_02950 [Clostridia bacterium]|nr:hypothetical protein [Clostridia bacterium]
MKRKAAIWLAVALAFILAVGAAAVAGSGDDPLITLSYLKEIFLPQVKDEIGKDVSAQITDEIQALIDAAVEEALAAYEPPAQTVEPVQAEVNFKVLRLEKGQVLLGGEGCEIIWRSGRAMAISTYDDQGLADMTAGAEVFHGEELARNHFYNIPRQDGRGLEVLSGEAYLMVRGDYTLSQAEASE